jgi:hypothetical protein
VEVTTAFLADLANTDLSGKVNAIGIFGQVMAKEFPATVPNHSLVVVFNVKGVDLTRERTMTVTIRGGTPELICGSTEVPMTFPTPGDGTPINTAQFIVNSSGLILQTPGEYLFDVSVDSELKCAVRLDALLLGQPNL